MLYKLSLFSKVIMDPTLNTLLIGFALGAAALAGQQAEPLPYIPPGRKRLLEIAAGGDVRTESPPRQSLLRRVLEDAEEEENVKAFGPGRDLLRLLACVLLGREGQIHQLWGQSSREA